MGAWATMRFLAATALAATLVGCGSDPASQEDNLIGGEQVARDAFAATVRLPKSKCTAAIVGERHILTAAHCVFDAGRAAPMAAYASDAWLEIDTANGVVRGQVEETFISPSWADACTGIYCGIAQIAAQQDAADVALIVLREALPNVAAATIAVEQMRAGDEVVIQGFGCDEGLYEDDAREEMTLASATARVVPASDAVHEGSYIEREHVETASGAYFMTAGPAHPDGGAGLCPGDSGGPVYLRRGDDLLVAGVNANYSLRPESEDPVGLPVTNWHTRLDVASRHEIAAWLTAHDVVTSAAAN